MRIAIVNITRRGMSGGYREYLLNMIPRLASDERVDSLLCLSPGYLGVAGWFDPIPTVEFVDYSTYDFFRQKFDDDSQRKLERFSPDLIFVPVEKPFEFRNIPVVTMIQNMEPLVTGIFRNPLAETLKSRLQYAAAKTAVKNSARVIALSEFVRDFLTNAWHVSADKIGLVYHGLSSGRNPVPVRPENMPLGWDGNFLFTAGSIRPARGLEDLILAAKDIDFAALGIKGVVIAGEVTSGMAAYKQKLLNLIKNNNLSTLFVFLDKIDSARMAWCYQNCRVFIMTSRVESFGMIGVEAMSHGCVCAAAGNPPLPEIFQDAAFYYRPEDGRGLARAIQNAISLNAARRDEMSQKAKKMASRFSWDVCAEKTMAVLSSACER